MLQQRDDVLSKPSDRPSGSTDMMACAVVGCMAGSPLCAALLGRGPLARAKARLQYGKFVCGGEID